MATDAATTAETRVFWCACGWSGSGLAAMQEHLDHTDDGTDTHTEMA